MNLAAVRWCSPWCDGARCGAMVLAAGRRRPPGDWGRGLRENHVAGRAALQCLSARGPVAKSRIKLRTSCACLNARGRARIRGSAHSGAALASGCVSEHRERVWGFLMRKSPSARRAQLRRARVRCVSEHRERVRGFLMRKSPSA